MIEVYKINYGVYDKKFFRTWNKNLYQSVHANRTNSLKL